jgi:CheY-like chemotaxis protein
MDIQSGEFRSIEEKLTEVREASRFGAETVRRLNRFVRQVEPGGKDEIQLFDLSDAVRTVVTMSRPLWSDEPKKKGLSLNLDCRVQDGCTIRGSKGDLFEVILNLIKNAVEALPDGGDIAIVTLREKNHVVLSIRDTGVGIPASRINRLFTPFFTTSLEAGRGLGLSTCRTIIDAHGGNIRVDSTEGTGTTFTIRLPFVFEQDDTAEEADLVKPLNPLHILVIDDMEGTVRLLKSGLGKMGHVVFTALSGEQGLALLEDNPVDVVICDLGMPGMNGWQVGEAIKRRCAEGGMTKPKFIILTGWGGQSAEQERIAASGVDAVVEKPVDMAKLLDVVRNLMEADKS